MRKGPQMAKRVKIPKLPQLLDRKIYKSGQTRGADDDEIYQNRVNRNSTALIRYDLWTDTFFNDIPDPYTFFEKDFIVLIDPVTYFSFKNPEKELARYSLRLGVNCLVFYQRRQDWDAFPPETKGWKPATSRINPLGGEYVARVHGTTAAGVEGEKIAHGFTTTGMKGAGIRVYEYANSETTKACRIQLTAAFWMRYNSIEAACEFGMTKEDAEKRKAHDLKTAEDAGLLDYERLISARIINDSHITICPLCLEPLDAFGFFNRKAQAQGREKFDLTITELNLFHIKELRPGEFNHRPYNLGWGHHLCNVVIGDEGIDNTIKWMFEVIERNKPYYHFIEMSE